MQISIGMLNFFSIVLDQTFGEGDKSLSGVDKRLEGAPLPLRKKDKCENEIINGNYSKRVCLHK